jgi:hypothetical protein
MYMFTDNSILNWIETHMEMSTVLFRVVFCFVYCFVSCTVLCWTVYIYYHTRTLITWHDRYRLVMCRVNNWPGMVTYVSYIVQYDVNHSPWKYYPKTLPKSGHKLCSEYTGISRVTLDIYVCLDATHLPWYFRIALKIYIGNHFLGLVITSNNFAFLRVCSGLYVWGCNMTVVYICVYRCYQEYMTGE